MPKFRVSVLPDLPTKPVKTAQYLDNLDPVIWAIVAILDIHVKAPTYDLCHVGP